MTMKDKLEIGLKEDAPFRRDNLPEAEKAPDGPATQPGDPTRSPVEPAAIARARTRVRRASQRRRKGSTTPCTPE